MCMLMVVHQHSAGNGELVQCTAQSQPQPQPKYRAQPATCAQALTRNIKALQASKLTLVFVEPCKLNLLSLALMPDEVNL